MLIWQMVIYDTILYSVSDDIELWLEFKSQWYVTLAMAVWTCVTIGYLVSNRCCLPVRHGALHAPCEAIEVNSQERTYAAIGDGFSAVLLLVAMAARLTTRSPLSPLPLSWLPMWMWIKADNPSQRSISIMSSKFSLFLCRSWSTISYMHCTRKVEEGTEAPLPPSSP